MIRPTDITITGGKDQFYPTPGKVAEQMLQGIDWNVITNVLEPSAGKGDLVMAARRRAPHINIDCIEIDPYLRAILQQCAPNTADEYDGWRKQQRGSTNIVHDDFLTYRGWRKYQLILMNPPFSGGDLHLLKALELQKDGGSVVCLLNAQTLLNSHSNARKTLKRELEKYGAQIEIVEDAFKDAERRADVDVAIVRVTIPERAEYQSDIWERMERAEKESEFPPDDVTDLVAGDYIEQAIQRYNVEVAASLELIRQYHGLRPYIKQTLKPDTHDTAIITLSVGTDRNVLQKFDTDEYLRKVRLKYWRGLFENPKFVGRLTSALRDDYIKKVERMADYDFSLFNIRTIMAEMNAGIIDGVKEAILKCFDKLTSEHSYNKDIKGAIHYYNGWKTNKAHKIVKKSIIPTWGMFSQWQTKNAFEVSTAFSVLSDIEKVFDYLNGTMSDESDLRERLQIANQTGKTRNIPLKYFDVDLYKKGTTHIKYRDMSLVEKMNIYAGRNKNWLPPNYGKKTYAEMNIEEKSVVDNFQGAAEYAKVLSRKDYYLAEPVQCVPALMAANE